MRQDTGRSIKQRDNLLSIEKEENIAKGTTDPGVDFFDKFFWFGRFSSVCLVG